MQQQQMMWQQQQQQQQWSQWQQQPQPQKSPTSAADTDRLAGVRPGDSPRTADWKRKMYQDSAYVKAKSEDWLSKREKAGPAKKAPSGAAAAAERQEEDEPSPQGPSIPSEMLANLFTDDRPWAEIKDDADAVDDDFEEQVMRLQRTYIDKQAKEEHA